MIAIKLTHNARFTEVAGASRGSSAIWTRSVTSGSLPLSVILSHGLLSAVNARAGLGAAMVAAFPNSAVRTVRCLASVVRRQKPMIA